MKINIESKSWVNQKNTVYHGDATTEMDPVLTSHELKPDTTDTTKAAQLPVRLTRTLEQILNKLVDNNLITSTQKGKIEHDMCWLNSLDQRAQSDSLAACITSTITDLQSSINNRMSGAEVKHIISVIDTLSNIQQEYLTSTDKNPNVQINNNVKVNPQFSTVPEKQNPSNRTTTMSLQSVNNLPMSTIFFDPTIQVPSSAPDISKMDGPTGALFALLWVASNPISSNMNTNSNNLISLSNNTDIISKTASTLKDVISFFQANPTNGNINVFKSFYGWLKKNNPNYSYLGSTQNPITLNSDEQAFTSVDSLFQSMEKTLDQINQKLIAESLPTITVGMLASGDKTQLLNNTLDKDNIVNCPEQIFMDYWTHDTNTAGSAINGLTYAPIFGSAWTQLNNEPSANSLYQKDSSTGLYYLDFNSTNVANYIGTNSSQSTTGVLQLCQQAQTTANTTNSSLMATQTYLSNQYSNYINTAISMIGNLKFQF